MQFWSSAHGFTLISMLIAMTILVLTLPFVYYALSTLQIKQTYTESLSIQQLFTQLRNDIISSTSAHIADNQLYIRFIDQSDNIEKTARFSQYNNSIRRQINGQGHEIYLHQVSNVVFEEQSNAIFLTITMESGEFYEKILYTYP
ncbi:competence type IV pilus minor pilin ComGF [Oceanobacillus sp. FSL W8-0428]|uniref:Competence protein ComGF n=1 Tax=Oceanobacillus sojae TaxID=582851 RepID=A0A511ZIY4_9BACI|nr:competence type IV pilus minor pilin ComGF [Oceanobacillus sojae]GEN87395.1 competence protein ComGF [Oceanobacillus sojae]